MRGFEGLQLVCQQDQRFVARLMPELVIDRLEAIDIDQDETKGHCGPPPEILGAPGQEPPAIQQPGQGIALGELGEALTRRNRGVALNPKRPQPRGCECGQAHDLQCRGEKHHDLVAAAPQYPAEIHHQSQHQRRHGKRPAYREVASFHMALAPSRSDTDHGHRHTHERSDPQQWGEESDIRAGKATRHPHGEHGRTQTDEQTQRSLFENAAQRRGGRQGGQQYGKTRKARRQSARYRPGDAGQDEQADLRPYDTPQHDRRRPAAVPEKEASPQTDGKAEIEQRCYSQQRKGGPDRQRCQFELPLCRCTGNDPQLEQVVTFEPFQPQPDSLGRDFAGRSKCELPADMPFVRKSALGHRLRYLDPVLVLEIYIQLFETRDLNSKRSVPGQHRGYRHAQPQRSLAIALRHTRTSKRSWVRHPRIGRDDETGLGGRRCLHGGPEEHGDCHRQPAQHCPPVASAKSHGLRLVSPSRPVRSPATPSANASLDPSRFAKSPHSGRGQVSAKFSAFFVRRANLLPASRSG